MKSIQAYQLWDKRHLEEFAINTVKVLHGLGIEFQPTRVCRQRWAAAWTGGGVQHLVVARPWAYPGLWRIHINLPCQHGRRMNYWDKVEFAESSEVTVLGEELPHLARLAVSLASGCASLVPAEVAFTERLCGPGYEWSKLAREVWDLRLWDHRGGSWHPNPVTESVTRA